MLVAQRDEDLEAVRLVLEFTQPQDVVDPAGLLFYRAIAHHHFAQSLSPGRNHTVQGEGNFFIALDRTVKNATVQEGAFVVHFDD